MELKETEMYEVSGGGISWGVFAGIAAMIAYAIGILSGYTNPTRCNN